MKKQNSAIAKKQTNQATIKLQKEKIENRLLTVVATALAAIMLLMYLFNWFQPFSNMLDFAPKAVYILMSAFFVLMIYTAVKGILLGKASETERAKKHWNWFFVSLAGFLGSFYVWPTEILTKIFKIDPLNLVAFNNFHPFLADNGVQFRAAILMCGVGLYAVVAIVYYSVKSAILGKKQK